VESSLPERDGNEDRKGTAQAKIQYELLVARAVKAGKNITKMSFTTWQKSGMAREQN